MTRRAIPRIIKADRRKSKDMVEKINLAISSAVLVFVVNTEHRLTALETKINAPNYKLDANKTSWLNTICPPLEQRLDEPGKTQRNSTIPPPLFAVSPFSLGMVSQPAGGFLSAPAPATSLSLAR